MGDTHLLCRLFFMSSNKSLVTSLNMMEPKSYSIKTSLENKPSHWIYFSEYFYTSQDLVRTTEPKWVSWGKHVCIYDPCFIFFNMQSLILAILLCFSICFICFYYFFYFFWINEIAVMALLMSTIGLLLFPCFTNAFDDLSRI